MAKHCSVLLWHSIICTFLNTFRVHFSVFLIPHLTTQWDILPPLKGNFCNTVAYRWTYNQGGLCWERGGPIKCLHEFEDPLHLVPKRTTQIFMNLPWVSFLLIGMEINLYLAIRGKLFQRTELLYWKLLLLASEFVFFIIFCRWPDTNLHLAKSWSGLWFTQPAMLIC